MVLRRGDWAICVTRSTMSGFEGARLVCVSQITPDGYIMVGDKRYTGHQFPFKEFARRDQPMPRTTSRLEPDTPENRRRFHIRDNVA